MSDFSEVMAAHRRLSLIRALSEAPSYKANESLLHQVLDGFGLSCSRDQVRSELAWLRDQGLITLIEVSGLQIAAVTQRGQDVATARTTIPGVARPSASNAF